MKDMERTIKLNGTALAYTLERKQIKNVNLRVRGGRVYVSAPRWIPLAVIEGFLRERAGFVFAALALGLLLGLTIPAALFSKHSFSAGERLKGAPDISPLPPIT